jgi:putative ABC transport system permease protein
MTGMWKQIPAVTVLNLRSLPQRLGSSAVTVAGIAGVVVVFVGVLSMAEGFQRAMTTGGDPGTAIVLRAGATSETGSMLGLDTVRVIKESAGIARRLGRSQASAEFVVVVRHSQAGTGRAMNVMLRGVEAEAFAVRDDVRVTEGRSFQSGRYEVIVGRAVARQLGDITMGRSVHWGGSTWNVVGVFDANGGSVESQVWTDIAMLQQAFRRHNAFQAVYARLESPDSLDVLRRSLGSDPRFEVDVRRESEYYAEQSRALTSLITTAGVFIASLMAAGAMFGAVSTMYAAVVSRTREIATLRALGFGSTAVACSVLAEAAVLASAGGAVGALTAWALFDGIAVSTLNFQSMSQVAFAFAVTPPLITQAMVYAIGMGLIGAMWPSWRAARLTIAAGLREA